MTKRPWKHKNLKESIFGAAGGLGQVIKTEKNARIIFCIGVATILLALLLRCSAIELSIIILVVSSVFICEGFNTLLENTFDIIKPTHDGHIKNVKDISSGIVLLACISSATVSMIILLPKIFSFIISR